MAIGLCNGNLKAVNWRVVMYIMFGWCLTIPCAALVAGCVFAIGANAPNREYVDIYVSTEFVNIQ